METTDLLAVCGVGALAFFAYKKSANTPEKVEDSAKLLLDADNEQLRKLLSIIDAANSESGAGDAKAKAEASAKLAKLKLSLLCNLNAFIARRASCSLCALRTHLNNLNKAYAAILSAGFCVSTCTGAGYRFKQKELTKKIKEAIERKEAASSIYGSGSSFSKIDNAIGDAVGGLVDGILAGIDLADPEASFDAISDSAQEFVSNMGEVAQVYEEQGKDYIEEVKDKVAGGVSNIVGSGIENAFKF